MYYPPLNRLVTEKTFSTFFHDLVLEKSSFSFSVNFGENIKVS